MKRFRRGSRLPMIVTFLTLIFLYTPLAVMSVSSFNSSRFGGKWRSFSLVWYEKLFQDSSIWEALSTTLFIALIATLISTVLGTLSALALYRAKHRLKWIYHALVYTPLVVPDILIGIGLLFLFIIFISLGNFLLGVNLELGLTTIVIAHVTFCMSYVTLVVLSRLHEFEDAVVEAAYDLGADALYTFSRVTLPIIMPGIIAGALFAFTLSVDDFVITFFVKGAGDTTLPIFIESAMKKGHKLPLLNALSVIFLVFTFAVVFITRKILITSTEKKR